MRVSSGSSAARLPRCGLVGDGFDEDGERAVAATDLALALGCIATGWIVIWQVLRASLRVPSGGPGDEHAAGRPNAQANPLLDKAPTPDAAVNPRCVDPRCPGRDRAWRNLSPAAKSATSNSRLPR